MSSWKGGSKLLAAALAVAIVGALVMAGCGGGDSEPSTSGSATAKTLKLGVLYYDAGNTNWSKAYKAALEPAFRS